MAQDITIPTPVAPARPILSPIGTTTPATFGDGSSGVIDSLGNILKQDSAGNYTLIQHGEGNANTSAPSLGSYTDMLGREATLDNPIVAATTPGVMSNVVSTMTDAASRTVLGISLIDAVAICAGLICIIGALYTFSETRDVINTATKAVKTAATVAA